MSSLQMQHHQEMAAGVMMHGFPRQAVANLNLVMAEALHAARKLRNIADDLGSVEELSVTAGFLLRLDLPVGPDLKPEKVCRFEDEDFGIYFADRIAGKKSLAPTRDGRGVINTMVNCDDIITDLLSVNRFTIRYIDTPARLLLKRIEEVHTNRVIVYKVRRDILRIPRPAIWHVVPHEWAAAIYGLGGSMPILSRSTCLRILWGKHMHGRNLAKHPLITDDTTCPFCGGADSQYHIVIISHSKGVSTYINACRQKHIALLDIRRNHLRRTNNPVSTLFQAYLDFASTFGEERMSHTASTGSLGHPS